MRLSLAPVIKDFPVPLDVTGDLATDDYAAALEEVRLWFRQNQGFEIITDTF